MKFKLIAEISFSLLYARLKQSVVAAVGVTFGIAMFIALVSFMTGLNKLLDGLILNRTPHIRLYNEIKALPIQPIEQSSRYRGYQNFIHSIKPKDRGKEIYNAQTILKAIKSDDRVIDVAPKITTQVFYNTGTIELGGVVNGVDVLVEDKLFALSDYVTEGDIADLANVNNSIFVGKGIAEKMQTSIGDVIQVTTPTGTLTQLKVMGVIQFGIADIDDIQSYTSLSTAQKLLGKPASYITDLQVKVKDINMAPVMTKEYRNLFEVDAVDIETANAQFETGSKVRSTISYSVGIVLLIVAGFGIYNILNMLIYEKMDAIAILKATGFSGADVQWIFITLALIIGIVGGISGLGLGYILSLIISHIPFETQALPTIKTYPVNFNPVYYFIGISFALTTTYIAGLFPAKRAAKVDPVEIIRGK